MVEGSGIYILECSDRSYYTGITRREVDARVSEHQQGLVEGCYTATRLPVKLLFDEHYPRIDEAIAAERRIKGWSRAKKEAYMRGDFGKLSQLAKRGATAGKSAPASFETRPKKAAPQDEGA